MNCNICPRKCNAQRESAQGFCRAPECFKLARAALHFWEEPCISGKNGSGAVFFSGCNLKCVYCQNYEISIGDKGTQISDERLIEIFEGLIDEGAQNINLVNPTHYATRLAEVLSKWKCPVPIVYNSSGYESVETLRLFEGIVDIYLPDFKYIRSEKAQRYSRAKDYPQVVKEALFEMRRQQPEDIFENGIMKSGMIIRHLILPQNTNSSLEIIDYIKENFESTYLSLMAQYVPCGNLKDFPELQRKITKREYEKVVNYACQKGLQRVFVQELGSADKMYIPPFDLNGVI